MWRQPDVSQWPLCFRPRKRNRLRRRKFSSTNRDGGDQQLVLQGVELDHGEDLVEPNHDPHSHLHHHQTHHNLQTPTCQNHNALVEEITTKDFVPKAGEGEEGEVEKHEKPFPDHQQLPNHQHHPDSPTDPSTSHHHHHRSLCLQRQELGHCFQTKTE